MGSSTVFQRNDKEKVNDWGGALQSDHGIMSMWASLLVEPQLSPIQNDSHENAPALQEEKLITLSNDFCKNFSMSRNKRM